MQKPELIYCAGKNKPFSDVAIAAGFRLGAQLPCAVYHDIYFGDQDWKKPDRAKYMSALAYHRPHMATVLDWERAEQLQEVLDWADEASQYADSVLIIPKVDGGISKIPRIINNKRVVLAYSVPTKFGGTKLSPNQFAGWPVHLLGGSPHMQMSLWRGWFSNISDVVSVDGNMHNKIATQYCKYWMAGKWLSVGKGYEGRAPIEAFTRSCINIADAWRNTN